MNESKVNIADDKYKSKSHGELMRDHFKDKAEYEAELKKPIEKKLDSLVKRFYTKGTVTTDWVKRDATITNAKGEVIFEQKDVEFPDFWSQQAVNITTEKYFRGKLGTPQRETSLRQMIFRVVNTITEWGKEQGYFGANECGEFGTFFNELTYILTNQIASFNSPVWFNVGIEEEPQCSACFIQSVEDSMEGIMELARNEAIIFKGGSGTGTNFSTLRSSKESLSGGGKSSGPLSFMRGFDSFAGAIKSGGKTRRAACMRILDISHPDILEFIRCKVEEEVKAKILRDAGIEQVDLTDISVQYQNANHTVRVSNEFMEEVENEGRFWTHLVVGGISCEKYWAKKLFREIAKAAHACGCPGIQFSDTINSWNTLKESGEIKASNPCSELLTLDDCACNLASINLRKFQTKGTNGEEKDNDKPKGFFDVDAFEHVVKIMTTAMDILVSKASYPTEKITKNANDYRQLGLGYTNLGGMLMAQGIPYDSDNARGIAASITDLMTVVAYRHSMELARKLGTFPKYEDNRICMNGVVNKHYQAHVSLIDHALSNQTVCPPILRKAEEFWNSLPNVDGGYRNSQVTLLAPTGTISFMMDADTTGIEPELALVKTKKLVGGGQIEMISQSAEDALFILGYDQMYIGELLKGTSTDILKEEHKAIFDCALEGPRGRQIHSMGHIKMLEVVQPFLSGGISKTINLSNEATVEDIENLYMEAWKRGLKSITVYRDGCKANQPITTKSFKDSSKTCEHINIDTKHYEDTVDRPTPLYSQQTKEEKVDELIKETNRIFKVKEAMQVPNGGKCPAEVKLTEELAHVTQEQLLSKGIAVQPITKPSPIRVPLPDERKAVCHKFEIAGHKGYLHVGLYDDGRPGEIFITMAKVGSTISGLMDSLATAVSIGLQHGVPLDSFISKFTHVRFEPSGLTKNFDIRIAKSIVDYIFRWLELKFGGKAKEVEYNTVKEYVTIGERLNLDIDKEVVKDISDLAKSNSDVVADENPACPNCGHITVRSGNCHRCLECGESLGCS